jgi:hypothetical protein
VVGPGAAWWGRGRRGGAGGGAVQRHAQPSGVAVVSALAGVGV